LNEILGSFLRKVNCSSSTTEDLLELMGCHKMDNTLWDASTKFFHAQAIVKYRRNLITQLLDDEGNTVVNHNQCLKAARHPEECWARLDA
jgi:hypothetical protein